jgi:hypothetical protein
MREEGQGPSFNGAANALETVHGPTARIVQQLRQARLKLERAASPEFRLSPAIRALSRTEALLARPLRVAVVGEFNAGKSSLANLLAGIESLPTAIISNTRFPTLLYYSAEPEIWIVHNSGKRERLDGDHSLSRQAIFRVEVGLPTPRLRAMQVLDLPGFADPLSGGVASDPAVHNVDVAVWCTVCTQAWKESERVAWEMLPARLGSRGILVATHRDLLADPSDRRKLLARLRHEVGTSFKSIILVSTLEALAVMGKDRRGLSGAAWIASGADALEGALGALLHNLREQRASAALRMTSRIAQRALVRIDGVPAAVAGRAQ